eukprot:m.58262 g.58262  ORF g.58262 m.58262 type:complete len:983 (-) comp12163_c0_seq1:236-3184(-)
MASHIRLLFGVALMLALSEALAPCGQAFCPMCSTMTLSPSVLSRTLGGNYIANASVLFNDHALYYRANPPKFLFYSNTLQGWAIASSVSVTTATVEAFSAGTAEDPDALRWQVRSLVTGLLTTDPLTSIACTLCDSKALGTSYYNATLRTCLLATTCTKGDLEITAPTTTSNRVCAPCYSCPTKKYPTLTCPRAATDCASCSPSCATCAGPNSTQCTSCPANMVLSSGACSLSCPQHFLLLPYQPNCVPCSQAILSSPYETSMCNGSLQSLALRLFTSPSAFIESNFVAALQIVLSVDVYLVVRAHDAGQGFTGLSLALCNGLRCFSLTEIGSHLQQENTRVALTASLGYGYSVLTGDSSPTVIDSNPSVSLIEFVVLFVCVGVIIFVAVMLHCYCRAIRRRATKSAPDASLPLIPLSAAAAHRNEAAAAREGAGAGAETGWGAPEPALSIGVVAGDDDGEAIVYRKPSRNMAFHSEQPSAQREGVTPLLSQNQPSEVLFSGLPPGPKDLRPPPRREQREFPGRDAVIDWFRKHEWPRRVGTHNGVAYTWFLGFVPPLISETMLSCCPAGTFHLRMSERYIGYILSVHVGRGTVNHYLVQRAGHFYRLAVSPGLTFLSVEELVEHFKASPIPRAGKLRLPYGDNGNSFHQLLRTVRDIGAAAAAEADTTHEYVPISGRVEPDDEDLYAAVGGEATSLLPDTESAEVPRPLMVSHYSSLSSSNSLPAQLAAGDSAVSDAPHAALQAHSTAKDDEEEEDLYQPLPTLNSPAPSMRQSVSDSASASSSRHSLVETQRTSTLSQPTSTSPHASIPPTPLTTQHCYPGPVHAYGLYVPSSSSQHSLPGASTSSPSLPAPHSPPPSPSAGWVTPVAGPGSNTISSSENALASVVAAASFDLAAPPHHRERAVLHTPHTPAALHSRPDLLPPRRHRVERADDALAWVDRLAGPRAQPSPIGMTRPRMSAETFAWDDSMAYLGPSPGTAL